MRTLHYRHHYEQELALDRELRGGEGAFRNNNGTEQKKPQLATECKSPWAGVSYSGSDTSDDEKPKSTIQKYWWDVPKGGEKRKRDQWSPERPF